jgi:methyl-accepting chemotaxis protein
MEFGNKVWRYFSALPAGRKLMVGTCTLLILLVAVSGLGFLCNQSIEAAFNRAVNEGSRHLLLSAETNRAVSEMMVGQTRFVLLTLQNDPDAAEAAKQSVHSASDRATKTAGQLRDSMKDPEARKTVEQLIQNLADWNAGIAEMEKDLAADNIPAAMAVNDRLQVTYKNIGVSGEKIESQQLAALDSDKRAAQIRGWVAGLLNVGSLVLAVVIGSVVIGVVRETNVTLDRLSGDVAGGGRQIAEAASHVSQASQTLAEQASQQSASLQETAASAKEVLRVARQSSQWARDAVALTDQTEEHVKRGASDVQHLATCMKFIVDSGRKITSIVSTIDQIAFQTKILSLNAAIEAAHAGEHGAGFAVVAMEVQALAQRCAQAASDSELLLSESERRTSESTKSIGAVETSIQEITNQCGRVRDLISHIDSGTRDQTRNLAQIDHAIGELEVVTSSVAATAQESASMAGEFDAQAASLRGVVTRLASFVGGAAQEATAEGW